MANFKPLPTPKPKVYLCVKEESFNTLFALLQCVELINTVDERFEVGVALNNPSLRAVAEYYTLRLPVVALENVPSSIPLVELNPSDTRVEYWKEMDHSQDEEALRAKNPHIDPSQLRAPDFVYSQYHRILRDAIELFDLGFPENRPSALYDMARRPIILNKKKMGVRASYLKQLGILPTQHLIALEEGFAGWDGSPLGETATISIPSASDALQDKELAVLAVEILHHPMVVSIGLRSSDWTLLGASVFRTNPSVVWDLRPSQSSPGEDQELRRMWSLHVPGEFAITAPNHDPTNLPMELVNREMAWAVTYYHQFNEDRVRKNKNLELPPKPITPENFVWNGYSEA